MLKQIAITNFIFIEEAVLHLSNGFNVVSGETGAGKSLFLGALNTTLGEKVSSEFIQPGKSFLKVASTFELSNFPKLRRKVEDLPTETNTLTLTRTITKEGKSKCYVNDELTNVQRLRELASAMIDLHGQHQNQRLFNPKYHLEFYDKLLGLEALFNEYKKTYKDYIQAKEALDSFRNRQKNIQEEKDFLLFTINELEKDWMSETTYNQLHSKLEGLEEAEKIETFLSAYHKELRDKVLPTLNGQQSALSASMPDNDFFRGLAKLGTEAITLLEDLKQKTDAYIGLRGSASNLDQLHSKLAKAEALRKRHGKTLDQLGEKLSSAKQKLASLEEAPLKEEGLTKQLEEAEAKATDQATLLHVKRKAGRNDFEERIKRELDLLGMKGGSISIDLRVAGSKDGVLIKNERAILNEFGFENAELLYQAAPNVPFKPFRSIASGGEVSRLMLILKSLLNQKGDSPVMIFDEIDVGIGGRTALRVGSKLKSLAANRQVLVVTHLAQIAKFADKHFCISKDMQENKAITSIRELTGKEQLKEISRMLTGKPFDEEQLEMAKKFIRSEENL